MSAADLALVLVVVAAVGAVAAMVAATVALVRAARAVRATLEDLEADVAQARATVAAAETGVRRVDEAVTSAEGLAGELRTSSRFMRRVVVAPVVWVLAVFRGLGRAVAGLFGSSRRRARRGRRVAERPRTGSG